MSRTGAVLGSKQCPWSVRGAARRGGDNPTLKGEAGVINDQRDECVHIYIAPSHGYQRTPGCSVHQRVMLTCLCDRTNCSLVPPSELWTDSNCHKHPKISSASRTVNLRRSF
ncbi:hypothetical protein CY34DRAFT_143654 [Suillus luteus UH-Slu-Lm8-n1]|uniref:Uncharacterized protein n=1 Tax=Suillus luteus UH-Slu-Lm8-n1 TaxID=930992 RepID=A0A0D0B7P6_9AGAM|nr:hypothetical protein CY34DRAFT_143654 [Suillus luteus UH-Slu-Lm8-n1]